MSGPAPTARPAVPRGRPARPATGGAPGERDAVPASAGPDAPAVRVAIDGRFLGQRITGVQRYARELVATLDALAPGLPGFRFRVLVPRGTACDLPLRNIPVEAVGRLRGHAWEQLELPFHARGDVLFCPGNASPVIAHLMGWRAVVCVHDLSHVYFPDAYSRAFKAAYGVMIPLALRRASQIITVSESERRSIVARYPSVEERITAVQNGGLSSRRPAAGGPAAGAPRGAHEFAGHVPAGKEFAGHVLYVGSLSRRKNFPRMLEVAKDLAVRRGYTFVFIGGVAGGIRETQAEIDPALAARIRFLGQVDDTDALVAAYARAAVFMFPSLYEASPFPPIEAMGCGCPVVASAIPSVMERCGDAALYCDPEDAADIAAKVEAMMESEEVRRDYRERGLRRAAVFTWEKCARETLAVIARAARARSGPADGRPDRVPSRRADGADRSARAGGGGHGAGA